MYQIEAENIVKQYTGHLALNEVSIRVKEGSIFGLLGPNGAGKTTLIRIMNRITMPDSGSVLMRGNPLSMEDVFKIGYLPEERGLYKKMKAGEHAVYLARLKGLSASEAKKRLRNLFEKFGIEQWWYKRIEELSKGMAQKIQFIVTIIHEPELLIFDEPFSGFDPVNTELLKREILELKSKGHTIILSTHNMASVEELCDDIALINRSQCVLNGNVNEIRRSYGENEYEIKYKGPLQAEHYLGDEYSLLLYKQEKDISTIKVKGLLNNNANSLLTRMLPKVEILSYNEIIPTMNDIFINLVSNNAVEK